MFPNVQPKHPGTTKGHCCRFAHMPAHSPVPSSMGTVTGVSGTCHSPEPTCTSSLRVVAQPLEASRCLLAKHPDTLGIPLSPLFLKSLGRVMPQGMRAVCQSRMVTTTQPGTHYPSAPCPGAAQLSSLCWQRVSEGWQRCARHSPPAHLAPAPHRSIQRALVTHLETLSVALGTFRCPTSCFCRLVRWYRRHRRRSGCVCKVRKGRQIAVRRIISARLPLMSPSHWGSLLLTSFVCQQSFPFGTQCYFGNAPQRDLC